ncbi:MAG: hypothetical protein ABI778_11690, partial [Ignavibacteriota bacterium]
MYTPESYTTKFQFSIRGLLAASIFILSLFVTISAQAQKITVSSKFISATVDKSSGHITVLPIDNQNFGRIGFDQQLSFEHKSFFTCRIGTNTYYTNNDLVTLPAGAYALNQSGVTNKITDPNHVCDTIRTVWLNVNNSSIDIIQDVYPIDFTKSGQVVYKWRVTNHTGTPLAVACQYLEDVQITDP